MVSAGLTIYEHHKLFFPKPAPQTKLQKTALNLRDCLENHPDKAKILSKFYRNYADSLSGKEFQSLTDFSVDLRESFKKDQPKWKKDCVPGFSEEMNRYLNITLGFLDVKPDMNNVRDVIMAMAWACETSS